MNLCTHIGWVSREPERRPQEWRPPLKGSEQFQDQGIAQVTSATSCQLGVPATLNMMTVTEVECS
jgi:hypothetical protein